MNPTLNLSITIPINMFLDSIWLVELTFIFLLIITIYPFCRYFQQLRTQHEYESRATQTARILKIRTALFLGHNPR